MSLNPDGGSFGRRYISLAEGAKISMSELCERTSAVALAMAESRTLNAFKL